MIRRIITLAGLFTLTATAVAEPVGQVGIFLVGKEFGLGKDAHADSATRLIIPSKLYKYNLNAKIKSQSGTALGNLLGADGVSLAAFLEMLKPGSSSRLRGSFSNPGGTLPATIFSQTIAGTRTIPGLGSARISLTVVSQIDASGKCFLDVTDLRVRTTPPLTRQQRRSLGTIRFMTGSKLMISATPVVLFSRTNTVVGENSGSVVVNAFRTDNYNGRVTVAYTTQNGTADNSDYTPTSGTITFPDRVGKVSITVPILNNAADDGTRTFTIKLQEPINGAIFGARTETLVTIRDDE